MNRGAASAASPLLGRALENIATAFPEDLRMLGWALSYAARGFNVFPVTPRAKKPPMTEHGRTDATTDPDLIVAWWKRWPDANIAVATGPESNLAVLDIDDVDALKALPDELPDTWIVVTPRGGHHWYRYPAFELRNSGGVKGWLGRQYPGLDVRGMGGYVLAVPSVHPTGEAYAFAGERRRLAPWPEWLRPARNEAVRATQSLRAEGPKVVGRADRYAEGALRSEAAELASMAPDTGRNEKLNAGTYKLKKRYVEAGQLSAVSLADAMLDAALASGLSEIEARRTIDSAMRAP